MSPCTLSDVGKHFVFYYSGVLCSKICRINCQSDQLIFCVFTLDLNTPVHTQIRFWAGLEAGVYYRLMIPFVCVQIDRHTRRTVQHQNHMQKIPLHLHYLLGTEQAYHLFIVSYLKRTLLRIIVSISVPFKPYDELASHPICIPGIVFQIHPDPDQDKVLGQ